jgi:hypothetical protein
MRRISRSLVVNISLLALLCAAFAAKDESLEQLKAHFETARPEDRAEIGIRIGQLQLRNADKLYNDGNVEQAIADVNDIVSYSERARDAATQTNKRLKNVEIDVRKMAEKLRDIKRTLAFEDQPPVEQAIRRLEEVRTSLLKAMFAKENKAEKK